MSFGKALLFWAALSFFNADRPGSFPGYNSR